MLKLILVNRGPIIGWAVIFIRPSRLSTVRTKRLSEGNVRANSDVEAMQSDLQVRRMLARSGSWLWLAIFSRTSTGKPGRVLEGRVVLAMAAEWVEVAEKLVDCASAIIAELTVAGECVAAFESITVVELLVGIELVVTGE